VSIRITLANSEGCRLNPPGSAIQRCAPLALSPITITSPKSAILAQYRIRASWIRRRGGTEATPTIQRAPTPSPMLCLRTYAQERPVAL